MNAQIDHALEEIRRFRPSPEFAAQAVADESLYEAARADRLGFWADQARTLLEAAVTIYPDSQKLALQLIELHVKCLRRNEALAVVASFATDADRERLSAAVRGAYLAQQGDWSGAADVLQAAVLDGCRERFCLRWLVASWLALDRPHEAQSALHIWRAAHPGDEELAALREQVDARLEELDEPTDVMRVDEPDTPRASARSSRIERAIGGLGVAGLARKVMRPSFHPSVSRSMTTGSSASPSRVAVTTHPSASSSDARRLPDFTLT